MQTSQWEKIVLMQDKKQSLFSSYIYKLNRIHRFACQTS